MKTEKTTRGLGLKAVMVFLTILGTTSFASAMKDPSQVYCEAMGFTFTTEQAADGYTGYCMIYGEKVDSWRFMRGEASKDAGICERRGERQKTIEDPVKCWYTGTGRCLACASGDGEDVEITTLLNLSFSESTCGDGICGMPENHNTCQADCASGSADNLCDGASDRICDPDCKDLGQQDSDCQTSPDSLPLTKPVENTSTGCIPLLSLAMALLSAAIVKAKIC